MPLTIGDISVYLGPKEQNAPDSLLNPIVDFIASAKSRQRLMIAIQEIDNKAIAEAIIAARLRGVTIDLVMEQSYLLGYRKPPNVQKAFEAGGRHSVNRELFNAILRSTTDVKVDFNPDIFHQKFMILGNRVLTGSTNFTDTGVTKNLNHVVIIDDAEVANAYKKEFKEIREGRFGKFSVAHGPAPKEAHVSGIRVKTLFAPDHAPEMEIMKQIMKAEARVDFAVFTFSKSSGIDDALIKAQQTGIQVSGVLDRNMANQSWAPTRILRDVGVHLRIAGNRGNLGKVHHKLMTIDDKITIFGSFNYTGPANKSNDENIIIVGDLNEQNQVARQNQTQIALTARAEIERNAREFGEEIPS